MAEPPPLPTRPGPPRLPKTYTVGHERDASPPIGRAVLVVLAFVCLGLQAAESLFLPHANLLRLLAAIGRVGTSWACLIALTAGLGVARWPLAALHVGAGLWLEAHALMGTFADAYPAVSGGTSLVPALLGALFIGAGGWFGLSADLTAYLDRERAGFTVNSRLTTAAVLAVALGLLVVGLTLPAVLTVGRAEARTVTRAEPIAPPPQDDTGGRYALDLLQRAVQARDFGVFTAELSPEMAARTKPEWTRQVSAELTRRGPPLGFELRDVFFNHSLDHQRELTYCNVFAVYPEGKVCFHCNLSRPVAAESWQVDGVFIE